MLMVGQKAMHPVDCPFCKKEIRFDDEPFQCWGFKARCPHCKGEFYIVRFVPKTVKWLGTPHVHYKELRKTR